MAEGFDRLAEDKAARLWQRAAQLPAEADRRKEERRSDRADDAFVL